MEFVNLQKQPASINNSNNYGGLAQASLKTLFDTACYPLMDNHQTAVVSIVNDMLRGIGEAKNINSNSMNGIFKKTLNAASLGLAFPTNMTDHEQASALNKIRSWYSGNDTVQNSLDIDTYTKTPLFGSEKITHGDVFSASEVALAIASLPKLAKDLPSIASNVKNLTKKNHDSILLNNEVSGIRKIGANATNYSKSLQQRLNERGVAVGEGKLNGLEYYQAKNIANKYNTSLDVVGSRGAAEGRKVYNMNLPVGKNPPNAPGTTRSDIDFRIDTQHPQVNNIIEEINQVGKGAGNASTKHGTDHRPTYPPYIRITPDKQ